MLSLNLLSVPPFARWDPFHLFRQNEQGVWFAPYDEATLFQDSAGTAPVTADGDPVGLMLDKSKGLVLGANQYDFSDVYDQVSGTNVTDNGTGYDFDGTGEPTGDQGQRSGWNISTEIGKSYKVTFTFTPTSIGTAAAFIREGFNGTGTVLQSLNNVRTLGDYQVIFTATTSQSCLLYDSALDESIYSFTNISVRELPGNHATQSTSAARPIYRRGDSRGIVNLLKWSEAFDNAVWSKTNVTITPNAIAAPNGETTADKLVETTAASALHRTFESYSQVSGTTYTFSVRAKKAEKDYVALSGNVTNGTAVFNISNGTLSVAESSIVDTNIVDEGDGWYTVSIEYVGEATATRSAFVMLSNDGTVAGLTYTGNGVDGIYIWGAQLEESSTPSTYQRNDSHLGGVATGFNTDLRWSSLDGADDSMSTTTGGGGTTGFFFCQAVAPLGGAGTARTLWSDTGTNTGYRVRLNASNQLELAAGNGTTYTTIATVPTLAVNDTDVVMAWDDGVNLNVQIGDGAVASVARPVVSAGTAGFTLGKDNGAATSFFNGFAYEEVYVKNSGLTATERAKAKAYIKTKAGLI